MSRVCAYLFDVSEERLMETMDALADKLIELGFNPGSGDDAEVQVILTAGGFEWPDDEPTEAMYKRITENTGVIVIPMKKEPGDAPKS